MGTCFFFLALQHGCNRWSGRLWGMPGRMCNGSHGLLFGSRLHLGGYYGINRTCFYNRLQLSFRNMSSGLCCCVISPDLVRVKVIPHALFLPGGSRVFARYFRAPADRQKVQKVACLLVYCSMVFKMGGPSNNTQWSQGS